MKIRNWNWFGAGVDPEGPGIFAWSTLILFLVFLVSLLIDNWWISGTLLMITAFSASTILHHDG